MVLFLQLVGETTKYYTTEYYAKNMGFTFR